jgi:hypothetical protein
MEGCTERHTHTPTLEPYHHPCVLLFVKTIVLKLILEGPVFNLQPL